jgi:ABC-2 type transport system permease protein
MSAGAYVLRDRHDRRSRLRHQLRILRVIAATEYKLKYSDSALGYVWSLAKPLSTFAVLYVVFGRFFKLNTGFSHYPVYLLIGIVLWNFFLDGASLAMTSLTARSSLLRKMAFPRLVIPISVTLSVGITFAVNLVAIAVFLAFNHLAPHASWLWIPLLLLELYAFTLGVGLVLATLFVRLRDVSQVWELLAQLLFYAAPIIYPVGFLPPWAKPIAFVSPFVQVMQDVRALILPGPQAVTATTIYGTHWGYALPLGFCLLTLVGGIWLFRREEPWFAERV